MITAAASDQGGAAAVSVHVRASEQHRAWRERGGMWADVYGEDPPRGLGLPWSGADAPRLLAKALASQVVTSPVPPTWGYRGGLRLEHGGAR
jgi:hypothetical protein